MQTLTAGARKGMVQNRLIAIALFVFSFGYYSLMSAKEYTWLFASGDSGDWLAASNWWIVPQPYGSPLYISLGHLLDLLPGDLVVKMTILLSCLPAAVTVALVYLIVVHLTERKWIAFLSSTVLLGAGIFLTQATVLEQYSLAVMFVVLAYYFYLKDRKGLVALSLGLGSANHILVIPIAALWLFLDRKRWREWFKAIPVYIISGILPYGLVLYLMTIDTPRLLGGGGLSLGAINSYLGSTSVFGTLSIMAFPERALDFFALILMSFGLAVIPVWLAFKRPWSMQMKLLVLAIAFPIWYYLTSIDPTTWTFMAYACPFVAIATGVSLTKVNQKYAMKAVVISAVMLIVLNSTFLNAGLLVKDKTLAKDYYNEIMEIPDGSAVVTYRGGFQAMAMFYAMSEGKEITPIFLTDYGYEDDALYQYYVGWINNHYELDGSNTQEMVVSALGKNIDVYVMTDLMDKWKPVFNWDDTELDNFGFVRGVEIDYEVHPENNRQSIK
jgi:hypothetical protein